jgi:dTMP kinase
MQDVGASGPRGRLITIEGVEGAGKSTQAARLAGWLADQGHPVLATAEPDGTPVGRAVRRLLGDLPRLDPVTECLLFGAARAEHVRRVIGPALARGTLVVSDRYADSTAAYQGYGRGVPLDVVAEVNRLATGGLWPHLTVVLDLDAAEGLRRVAARGAPAEAPRGAAPDPFERLSLEFHERVRKGYWAPQAREPERVVLVDAGRPTEVVAGEIRTLVAARLGTGAPA